MYQENKTEENICFDRLSVYETTVAFVLGWYANCVLDTV